MVQFAVPLPQQQNVAGSILEGYQAGQGIQLNQLKLAAAQQEMLQKQKEAEAKTVISSLAKAAALGDSQAMAQISALAPDVAKGINEYNNIKIGRQAQLLQPLKGLPLAQRDSALKSAIELYKTEFNEELPVGQNYTPENLPQIESLIARGRDVEKMAAEQIEAPKREADLALTKAKTGSEYLGQQKTRAEIGKTYEELASAQAERQAMKQAGFTSPAAFKKFQEKTGELQAETAIGIKKPLSGEASKVLTIATSGLDKINELRNVIQSEGGSATGLASGAALPTALQSASTQKFSTLREDLSDLIGRLRSGGAINKDEEARFTKLLPRFGDKPETVGFKLNQLNKTFQEIEGNITGKPIPETSKSLSGNVNGISWRLK
jgi:hypothetical protein